ncbi:hypothetical protein PF003_g14184 [Phytophthora fragariae]|nr:hypothetical protein PF003_g14184 [Phytophthora fragariae]
MEECLARVGSTVRALVRGWESIQVELHGSYSVERFISMQKYRDSTSVCRSLMLLGAIPLLSLACAGIVDAFPLESPDLGLAHSGTLWARGVLVTLFDSHALSWMFDQYVPQLEISRRTLIVTAIAAAVVVQASALILILLLWYPLPFTLIWVSGPWIWTLALALKLSKGEFLRKNPQVLNETVPAEWQTPAAVLVPVFKVIQKNVICRLLRGQDDVKPEIVNFNVDVTNALFISSIMQNLQSVKSSAMLVVVDFVQMLTSLFDLRLMLKDIRDITNESTDQAIACALVIVGKYPELGELPLLTMTSKSDIFRSSKVSLQRKQKRYLLLDKVLQIMFFPEFILLTEFIEVFTPVMYKGVADLVTDGTGRCWQLDTHGEYGVEHDGRLAAASGDRIHCAAPHKRDLGRDESRPDRLGTEWAVESKDRTAERSGDLARHGRNGLSEQKLTKRLSANYAAHWTNRTSSVPGTTQSD